MCARTTQLYSIWSDLYGIFLLITMIVIRLFSLVEPMSTELKYTFSKCWLFLLILTCGLILCPYSSFSNSTFTSDFTANLLLSKSVHGTVFSFVHLSVCFGRITQYCQWFQLLSEGNQWAINCTICGYFTVCQHLWRLLHHAWVVGEERECDSNDAQVVRCISGPQGTFSPDKILPALVWKQKFIVTYVEFSDFFFII